jgi:hypothetical protein
MGFSFGESERDGNRLTGAGDGIRTRDIDLGKVALYQLSYSRPWENSFSPENAGCVKRSGQIIGNKGIFDLDAERFLCARLQIVETGRALGEVEPIYSDSERQLIPRRCGLMDRSVPI